MQWSARLKAVALCEPLEGEVAERVGRLPYCETRVAGAFHQDDRSPASNQAASEDRAGEPAAEDQDVDRQLGEAGPVQLSAGGR